MPGLARYAQQLAGEMLAVGIDNPTTGFFSPTEATKGSELRQLQNDRINAIVTGREPLTSLNGWVPRLAQTGAATRFARNTSKN